MYLLSYVFRNPNILKLGFQFHHEDMKKLGQVFEGKFSKVIQPMNAVIDISREISTITSLSIVCQQYISKPLNKSYRLTDWRKRPLGDEQFSYAALDVHTLIAIFDAILLEKGVDVGLHTLRMYDSQRQVIGQGAVGVDSALMDP
jgi:ribonuclease D